MNEPAPLRSKNPQVQRLRRLARRRTQREAEGVFLVEGPTLVAEALHGPHPVEAVYAAPELAAGFRGRGAPVLAVDREALAAALDTITPQPAVAVVTTPAATVEEIGAGGFVLVLAGISDPGNAGALVRVAEASGVGGVIFCDGATDPFAPKCVRAAAGSVLRIRIAMTREGRQVLERLGAAGHRRLGASAHAGEPYDRSDLTGRLTLVLGHETHGVKSTTAEHLDGWVHVPMAGEVESLNVGVAGGVIAFEAARQRRRPPDRAP
ncbi:MAG: TrmH family RNA methyltransferase [Acidimicrobiia bacterium]